MERRYQTRHQSQFEKRQAALRSLQRDQLLPLSHKPVSLNDLLQPPPSQASLRETPLKRLSRNIIKGIRMSIATLALLVFVTLASVMYLGFTAPLLSIIAGIAGIVYVIAVIAGERR